MTQRIEAIEEQIAHLTRTVEELSDIAANQADEIARLNRRLGLLMSREADRDADGGAVTLGDQKPPHW